MAIIKIGNPAIDLDAAEIPNLDTAKITSGTFDVTRYADSSITNVKLNNNAKVVKASSAPSSPTPVAGDLWYDTTNEVLMVYDATLTSFVKVATVMPVVTSIDGNIITSTASNLTINGSGFLTANLQVKFTPSGGSTTTVTVTPTSDVVATVAVPSAIYGQSVNTVIAIKVTNSDNKTSGDTNKTVVDLPTGGTISNISGYRVHTFTSSGTFTNTIPDLSVQYLVIGGAGGSGRQHGGGGGAGGYRCNVTGENSGGGASAEAALTLSSGAKTVTVGLGGAGSSGTGVQGSDGQNSVFDTITSIGGGGGGSFHDVLSSNSDGRDGGSGGGAGSYSATNTSCGTGADGGTATANQGMNGGDANYAGGGGGGASVVGEAGCGASPNGDAGNGGAGISSAINGTSTGRAGGGGGGSYGGSNQSGGSRGTATNGGGNGGWGAESGTNGTVNTGGGAGGGGVLANGASSGGSGIVIVRYAI